MVRSAADIAKPRRLLAIGILTALAFGVRGDHWFAAADSFWSRPDLRPPELTVDQPAADRRSALLFVAPWRGDHQAGPMIVDGRGELVWFHPMEPGLAAMEFRAQRYRGEPVLTWWEGRFQEDGYGRGDYVVVDDFYREVARFGAGNGLAGDFHEFLVTDRGTALVTIYQTTRRDLSALGGPRRATVLESIVQELEIDTGRVVFEWRALDHIDPRESHQPMPSEPDEVFDFFHINSVDVDSDGNLLVSARHTDAIYKIDRRTGEVIWRLGGTRSDFELGPGARFSSQHDARRQPDGTLTLFDNADPPQRREHSRAVRLRLDPTTMTARLVRAVEHPLGLLSESQGNAQALPGGQVLVGWGSNPYFSRFDARGRLRFDAHFPDGTELYRAYQHRWSGQAATRPAVIARVEDDHEVTVYASWNGATEVTGWQVLAGTRRDDLRPVATAESTGFETTITAPVGHRFVAVRAQDDDGEVLGRSPTVLAVD